MSRRRKTPSRPAESDLGDDATVLPMELREGDRLTDETGDWEVVSRPWTTVGGKRVHVRMRKVGEPTSERDRSCHERVAVRRA